MTIMVPLSFTLNALVGVFLCRFAGDDLLKADPKDDRGTLWFMFLEGLFFLVFGIAGLILL